MDSFNVTFVQEKQFFLGNPTVKVIVDDKVVCELHLKSGDSATVPLTYGKHHLVLIGSGKRTDAEIYVKERGTIRLKWNKTFGQPAIDDLGCFAPPKDTTLTKIDPNLPLDISFGATKCVGNYLWINENNRVVAVPKTNLLGKVTGISTFKYEDILNFEIIQDGSSIIDKGGLGRAAVGGLLFGGAGAVVGGMTGARKQTQTCTELRIKITTNNLAMPAVFIDFIKGTSFKKDSMVYKQIAQVAEQTLSMLQIISSNDKEDDVAKNTASSGADEIRKYKLLYDEGIITEEEFNAKKRQILGI